MQGFCEVTGEQDYGGYDGEEQDFKELKRKPVQLFGNWGGLRRGR